MRIAYRPMSVPAAPKTPKPVLIQDFLGVDFSTDPTVIEGRRSPDMLNMIPDVSGILNKRTGYSESLVSSLGTGRVNGLVKFGDKWVLAHDGNLYEFEESELI